MQNLVRGTGRIHPRPPAVTPRTAWTRQAHFDRAWAIREARGAAGAGGGVRLPWKVTALGHTAITNVCRASRDLFLARRFARHASLLTTIVYTIRSDEHLRDSVRGLRCRTTAVPGGNPFRWLPIK